MDNLTFVEAFHAGGSAAKTFLVSDQTKRFCILKYADWEGIGFNGTPWVKTQTQRLIDLRQLLPEQVSNWLPAVYESHDEQSVFYTLIEYFENTTTLSEYYLNYSGELVDAYSMDIDKILSFFGTYLYSLGKIATPDNYVQSIHIDRVNYRLGLFSARDSETYKRYILDKKFSLGDFHRDNISQFFRDLIKSKNITINGKKYTNAAHKLYKISSDTKTLNYLTPAFLPKYTHGDSLLRNYLRDENGNIKMIDLRGNHLPTNTPSEVCIPYDLGKMLHSIWMDIIRSNSFRMEVLETSEGLEFIIDSDQDAANIANLLRVRDNMPGLFERNEALRTFLNSEPNWLVKSLFAEACHFLSDAVNRLEQDHTGHHSLAYYLLGTMLLNDLKF